MRSVSGHLTYANVISTIALFIALGGVSYAALKLPSNSVGTKQIRNRAITKPKLDPGLLSSLAGKPGLPGTQGLTGNAGAGGAPGTNGRDGAAGPSDIYIVGKADQHLAPTSTEVASLTVPAGSYQLGATMWFFKLKPGSAFPQCRLVSSEVEGHKTWDQVDGPLMTDESPRTSLSMAGADTFSSEQAVKVFCSAAVETNTVNTRLWAIRTGNLHATLPLPLD